MSWTDERVEQLKKLWMEGLSASQIASELGDGVTRNAVIGKVHRLKLSGRAKPTTVVNRPRPATRPARRSTGGMLGAQAGAPAAGKRRMSNPAPMIGATALKASEALDTEVEVQAVAETEPFIPEAERITLMSLNEHTCKWPIGDPLSKDFYFCGRDSEENRPYCEFHSRRAYHTVEKRKR
ncbi:MAG TPA: GcrA family cell cycle regulator [Devosiaceae bacterium]